MKNIIKNEQIALYSSYFQENIFINCLEMPSDDKCFTILKLYYEKLIHLSLLPHKTQKLFFTLSNRESF